MSGGMNGMTPPTGSGPKMNSMGNKNASKAANSAQPSVEASRGRQSQSPGQKQSRLANGVRNDSAGKRNSSNQASDTTSKARKSPGKIPTSPETKEPRAKQGADADPGIKGSHHDKNDENLPDDASKQGFSSENKEKRSLGQKAKGLSSNATGVDYSDKSTKDQLEHQAADLAMDATPVLSQFNSARRALKDYNATKKAAGAKEDGVSNKAEEASDKLVDGGIKATKMVIGASLIGQGSLAATASMLLLNVGMLLKNLAVTLLGKTFGLLTSVFSTTSSFVSSILGVGTMIGNAVTGASMAVVVATTSMLGAGAVDEFSPKDDSVIICVPDNVAVRADSQEYLSKGESDSARQSNAVKLWSVYERLGGSKEQAAAVLGNLQHESGLDPTSVETIYTEPFIIGLRKQSAEDSHFQIRLIDPSYAKKYKSIKYVGIGLGQWTNGRNQLLIQYANQKGQKWYEFDTQIKFMLEGDDPLRQKQLINFIKAKPTDVVNETERFMNSWIGLSTPNPSLSDRQQSAVNYMFILERATSDTDYANSIISGINVNRSEGNSAVAAYYQDDGCGNTVKSHYGNQSIDGTGEVPAGLLLTPWSRSKLPASLRDFAKNPEDAGLTWGNKQGWASGIIADQCAALAHSYFMRLYPEWNQKGRATERPYGDGGVVADRWAEHYGETATNFPVSGAVFSDKTTSKYGHTGIVQHVFANGDILICEQNIRGVSGRNAPGLKYSWSWRIIKKDRYEKSHWKFFKPADAEPLWDQGSSQ